MNHPARYAFIIAFFTAAAASAAPDDSGGAQAGAPPDPVLEKVTAATSKQDWVAAQQVLRDALAKDPGNAEYHNLFAYAMRKGANPNMDLVFKHYNEALRINPRHRGAHEYIGEAYLMVGNLAKAMEHLQALDRLCFFGCDEYSDLKKKVAEYEQKQVKQ